MENLLEKQDLKDMNDDSLLSIVQPEARGVLKKLVEQKGIKNWLDRLNQWAVSQENWREELYQSCGSVEDNNMSHMIDKALLFLWEQPEHQKFAWNLTDYPELQKVIKVSGKTIRLHLVKNTIPVQKSRPKSKV